MRPDFLDYVPTGPVVPGSLLVALPGLTDPNFRQTVVFMCETGEDGAMGLIINRPTELQLSEALPDEELLTGTDIPVFNGGPVQTERILLLRNGGPEAEDFTGVVNGVSVGGTMDALKEAATEFGIMGEFRPYRGYAGWGAGQLEHEIAQLAWAVLPYDLDVVFCENPKLAWQAAMHTLGGPLKVYATMPADISQN
ncbi:MAG: YqgE/AlgH family protein [Nitrospirota bacterium]|nr:YqgE/AlgH family protein [Nitrospirota bacterium]